jgi:predicted Zn-dependent peptidase
MNRFTMNRITLTLLAATLSGSLFGQIDRSQAPEPGPAPEIRIGDFTQFELDNGLTVILVENHKLPRITYRLTVDRDPIFEGGHAGYVSFAGSQMRKGTTSRSKAEIDEEIDQIGASLSTNARGIYGSCLTRHSSTLLSVLSDVLLHPTFPEEEMEKERKQTLSGLENAVTDASSISGTLASAITYGLKHPYGEPITPTTVKEITRDDMVDYYGTYFRPEVSYLVIVGDIDEATARIQAEEYFGAWEQGEVPENRYPRPGLASANRVCFAPVTGAVQSVIKVTWPVFLKPGHPDALPVKVMSSMLGGFFGSRLNQNLREAHAYTYGARASIQSDPWVGSFTASTSVRNDVTDSSLVQIMLEIERMAAESISDSELTFVKNFLNGQFARSLEKPETVARFALNTERYNLPSNYYENYLAALDAVTVEDCERAARNYLKPENANITIAGAREVADLLTGFAASGEVEFFGPFGSPLLDLDPAPEGMEASDVFAANIAAVGGEQKLAKVKSYIETASMEVGPGMMVTLTKGACADGSFQLVEGMGMVLQETRVQGDRGMEISQGQGEAMDAEKVSSAQREADLLQLLHLDRYGISATLLGMETVDEKSCYVVSLLQDGGEIERQWYDSATGLLYQSIRSESGPNGSTVITSKIQAYMEVKGLQFPAHNVVNAGGQTMEIHVSSVALNKKVKLDQYSVD